MSDLEKVRKRKSYKLFVKEAEFFDTCGPGSITKILRHIFKLLDEKKAWHSTMHAAWAEESMIQAIKDYQNDSRERTD